MKILDDWKVYGGVSDLKQPMEGIAVSQVIINSNYSDDHDDYDIALMKLSRPLTLSGEVSQHTWAWACLGDREMDRTERPLESPGNHGLCPTQLWPPHLSHGQEGSGTHSRGLSCATSPTWGQRDPAGMGRERSLS